MSTQCLYFALDKWRSDGGYLLFRKSKHWCLPHVLHLSGDFKVLTHYVPPEDLKHPVLALFGFTGQILHEDPVTADPMHPLCILTGSILLLILGGIWAFKILINNIKQRFFNSK